MEEKLNPLEKKTNNKGEIMAVLKITHGKEGTNIKEYYSYLTQKSKTKTKYISALNCGVKKAPLEMLRTKDLYNKKDGRQFYDILQTFDIGDDISPEKAHMLGVELAQKIFGKNYEVAIVTHLDKDYLHNHILINSVSFTTGLKFANKRNDLFSLRKTNEEILKRENLLTIAELKKQNRPGGKNNKAIKHMSERGVIPDKTYIIDCSNKILQSSNNMSEYIGRMAAKNIIVEFTEKNTYFKYNDRTYGQSSLGKEVSLDTLSKAFGKRSSHITLLRAAVIQSKEDSNSYEEFINNIKANKNIVVNERGQKTLSFIYGKRKPVRIEKLGYDITSLKSFFVFKEEYNLFNKHFNQIFQGNKKLTCSKILEIMKDNNIIYYDNIYDNNYIINDKKIPSEMLLREVKSYFNEQEKYKNNTINNIYKYLYKCYCLDDLYNLYNINSTIIKDEIIFTDKKGYYILPKNRVEEIFNTNIKRRDIWKSLSSSASLSAFLAYNAAELKEEKGIQKIFIDDLPIEHLGIKNSWGKNTLSFESIMNKINDNRYFLLNDTNTFRGQLRGHIYEILNKSVDIKDFYFKLNNVYKYKTRLKGDNILIYNPELKKYINLMEMAGRNDDSNPLSYNKLVDYFNAKNKESANHVDYLTVNILKNLFSIGAYRNNKNYNRFNEEYFKYIREKNSKKTKKTTV